MTIHFIRMIFEGVFALTVCVLLLEIGHRKTLVAGRFIGPRERPLSFWLWLAFDILAVASPDPGSDLTVVIQT